MWWEIIYIWHKEPVWIPIDERDVRKLMSYDLVQWDEETGTCEDAKPDSPIVDRWIGLHKKERRVWITPGAHIRYWRT